MVAPGGRAKAVERRAILELFEALGSSLDIRSVLGRVYPLLLRLVGADYGALGISPSGDPRDFEWQVAGIPPAFFAAYPQMAPHDFVRMAVLRAPNVVLRDQEMVGRRALEANPMYRRAREIGVPLEQVMAVMLHVDHGWQSGLSLYRDRRRPFTAHERAVLQDVTPALVNAVRNCQLYGARTERLEVLEALVSDADAGEGRMYVRAPATVVEQTGAAGRLLAKWFESARAQGGWRAAPLAGGGVRGHSEGLPGRRGAAVDVEEPRRSGDPHGFVRAVADAHAMAAPAARDARGRGLAGGVGDGVDAAAAKGRHPCAARLGQPIDWRRSRLRHRDGEEASAGGLRPSGGSESHGPGGPRCGRGVARLKRPCRGNRRPTNSR